MLRMIDRLVRANDVDAVELTKTIAIERRASGVRDDDDNGAALLERTDIRRDAWPRAPDGERRSWSRQGLRVMNAVARNEGSPS